MSSATLTVLPADKSKIHYANHFLHISQNRYRNICAYSPEFSISVVNADVEAIAVINGIYRKHINIRIIKFLFITIKSVLATTHRYDHYAFIAFYSIAITN